MSYPQICQTCYYSGGLAPAVQYPEYTRPLFCRKPETITEKIWPHVWPIVESTFFCINWRPQPTLIYHVTGTLSPDITGEYIEIGKVDGYTFLVHITKGYFIWFYDEPEQWLIQRPLPFGITLEYWYRADPAITGDYQPGAGATGIATLHAGPE
ncbi:hypothetical protein ES707_18430 [subsurface metagenome]